MLTVQAIAQGPRPPSGGGEGWDRHSSPGLEKETHPLVSARNETAVSATTALAVGRENAGRAVQGAGGSCNAPFGELYRLPSLQEKQRAGKEISPSKQLGMFLEQAEQTQAKLKRVTEEVAREIPGAQAVLPSWDKGCTAYA